MEGLRTGLEGGPLGLTCLLDICVAVCGHVIWALRYANL